MRKLALTSLLVIATMLIAATAALAANTRPKAGTWKVTDKGGGFTVTRGGKAVKAIHFNAGVYTGCGTGTITVTGSHKLRSGRDHSWLLGKPESLGIGVALVNVTAKLNGVAQAGAEMFLIFNTNPAQDSGYFSDNSCSFNFAFKK